MALKNFDPISHGKLDLTTDTTEASAIAKPFPKKGTGVGSVSPYATGTVSAVASSAAKSGTGAELKMFQTGDVPAIAASAAKKGTGA